MINKYSADPVSHKEIAETLETMIDSQGMYAVLTALANVCHEKAQHVLETWQDGTLAREWTRGAKRIEKAMGGETDWPL